MWALGRRTALFIVSYAPLAAMFMVLEWPSGWSACELAHLAAWISAAAALLVATMAASSLTGRRWHVATAITALAASAVILIGALNDWTAPMTLHAPAGKTSGTATGVAFGFCALAALLVIAILANARRAGSVHWRIVDPRDQGGAVAGYLATYLLPLVHTGDGDWRLTAAYAIYLFTVYVVFVRSESLVLVNPTLYVFGFRIYDVEIDATEAQNRRRVLVLMKSSVYKAADVTVMPLGDDAYLAKVKESE